MTDPIWWFYLFWVPGFLRDQYGLELQQVGLPTMAIYIIADVGSIGGGWLSSSLIKRGLSINAGRKLAMLGCALAVTPVIFVARVQEMWLAVALIGLAAAAHQGWSANVFTMVSDMFPRKTVGSVVGIGGMAGAVGGMMVAKAVGYILEWTNKNYLVPFLMAGSAYLLALLVVHLLAPRLQPPKIEANMNS
jgi:ACS family hexuronate transporter-like MFS transporter